MGFLHRGLSTMKSIEIAGKKYKLASRLTRMGALFIDSIATSIFSLIAIRFSGLLFFGFSDLSLSILNMLILSGCLLFMDGIKNGQGLGKRLLSLQVIRLKDGKPCTLRDSFIRRIFGFFQPIDLLFSLGENKQRMGDKIAETIVVEYESQPEAGKVETKDAEQELDNAILDITNRLSEARQKVDASIGIEMQFQNAYEGATVQAERFEEKAALAIQAGREDLAREDIAQRNEYRQLAKRYKEKWEEQKQVVAELTTLLETLQIKTEEAQRKKESIIAQHRNVDAQQHLQETLTKVQDGTSFEILNKMEQEVNEASTLAKAASQADSDISETKIDREFASYSEENSIDADLAELKAKLQETTYFL